MRRKLIFFNCLKIQYCIFGILMVFLSSEESYANKVTHKSEMVLANVPKEGTDVLAKRDRQELTITGVVTDPVGTPLPGVSIMIKGTSKGTATDFDGNYEIVAKSTDVLVFTYIGFSKKEVVVGKQKVINVKLSEDTQKLDDVVVVGFGTQKKASVVGAVQSVKISDLKMPTTNLSNTFAGRIAGVISMQQNAEPGADGANFWIRGAATFSGATNPLIFVDGIEVSKGDMDAIPPEAIENFSVLKDASATALYGARGANGVILITTRSGKNLEKARINIRINNSFASPTQVLKIADAPTVMKLRNIAIFDRNPQATPFFETEKIENTIKGDNPYLYPNVDWMDFIFKDMAVNQAANINLTGGTKKVDYFISASLNRDTGILKSDPNNKFNTNIRNIRYSIQSNVGAWLTSSTKLNLRINSQLTDYTGPSASVETIYQYALEAPNMYFSPYYENTIGADHILFGNQQGGPIGIGNSSVYRNPYATMVQGYNLSNGFTINTALGLDQKLDFLTEGLSFKALLSYKNWSKTSISRSFDPYYYQLEKADPNSEGGFDFEYSSINQGRTYLSTSSWTSGNRYINLQASVNYQHTFAEKHEVGAMLVYLQREYANNTPGNNYYRTLPTRNQGLAGRLTYAYDERYLTELNFGYNGSENFEKGKRFGFFPSVALGYLVSNEKFFEPLTGVVTNLKIRGSYGLVGNSNIGGDRFPYLTKVNLSGLGYTFGNNWQTWGNGAAVASYGADGVTWEIGTKYNLGIDLSLYNRFNLSVDFFRENRKDIFLRRQTLTAETGITGRQVPYGNLGRVKNQGVDLSFDYFQMINNDLMISARGTFTYAKNEYVALDEPNYQYKYMSRVGKPLHTSYGYIAEGLFQNEEEIKNSPKQELTSYETLPGDIKYKDLNGDGKIDATDKTYFGLPELPQISYGMGVSLKYKNLDFSFFFQGVAKRNFLLKDIHPFAGDSFGAIQYVADNYWSSENPNAEYPRLTNGINQNTTANSTFWLRDGSYLRLKSAEIGYTYKFARVYATGQNLLTFSKFKLWDPELRSSNGLKYPTQRIVTLGLQLTF